MQAQQFVQLTVNPNQPVEEALQCAVFLSQGQNQIQILTSVRDQLTAILEQAKAAKEEQRTGQQKPDPTEEKAG